VVEDRIVRIGQKIRQVRKEMGLSIRETAKLTQTSPATIQKIEANGMVPSIAILMKIAQGLRKNVSFFLGEDREPKEVALVPQNKRDMAFVSASKLKVEDLGSDIRDAKLEATLLTIDKGGRSGKDPLIHPGEEIKLCLEGKLAYHIDGQEYILRPGDCIHFKSDRPHFWKNIGQGQAKIISICTPPPFRRLTR